MKNPILLLLLLLPAPGFAAAATVHVVPTGQPLPPQAPSQEKIFVSSIPEALAFTRARATAAAATTTPTTTTPATIRLLPGRHELSDPLHFTSEDSGLSIIGDEGDASPAVISGGRPITGWAPCASPSSSHLVCAPLAFPNATSLAQGRHLFVNGRRAPRGVADSSVAAAFARPVSVDSNKYVVSAAASGAGAWGAGAAGVEMVYTAQGSPWTESRCTVANVTRPAQAAGGDNNNNNNDDDDDVLHVYMKQPCFSAVQAKPCGQSTHVPAYVENTGAAALRPGQWFLDKSAAPHWQAVYYPLAGEDMLGGSADVDVVMPVLETLAHTTGATAAPASGGSALAPATDLSFTNIVWEHATWRRPDTGLGYVEQQSGALVAHPGTECVDYEWHPMPSNVVFLGAKGVTISNCTFRHLGAGALQFAGGAHDNLVSRSVFYDVSGAAVQIGAYDTFNATDPAAQELRNEVSDCEINGVACEFHGNAGISVGYSSGTVIAHNDVGNLTYSGISIGWGWSRELDTYAGNNTVVGNKVHDFKLQTAPPSGASLGDGGGIYALGPQQGSSMKLNYLSNMGAGRGGGAFYPDEGSAYWSLDSNVFANAAFCEDNCQWLHIWTKSIHDINVTNSFTDTATQDVAGTNTPVTGTTVVPKGGTWPEAAQAIMKAAGIRAAAAGGGGQKEKPLLHSENLLRAWQ